MRSLFSLVLGQCTDALKAKLEALPDWTEKVADMNGLDLILQVKKIAFQFESSQYDVHALIDAERRFGNFFQGKDLDTQDYYRTFQNHVQVIEHCGGTLGYHKGPLQIAAKKEYRRDYCDLNADEQEEISSAYRDRYLACLFLVKSDRTRFGDLLRDLQNQHTQGHNVYPRTLNSAYSMLTNWKPERNRTDNPRGDRGRGRDQQTTSEQHNDASGASVEGASFNTQGDVVRTSQGAPVVCRICGSNHWPNNCPQRTTDAQQHAQSHGTQNESAVQHVMDAFAGSDDGADEGMCRMTTDDFSFCTTCKTVESTGVTMIDRAEQGVAHVHERGDSQGISHEEVALAR